MAQVKFYRGLSGAYLPSSTHKDCIFFATDTNQLMLNDVAYGTSASDAAILKNAITKVEWVSPDTIQFTCGNNHEHLKVTFPLATESSQGLMSAEQVKKLKGVEAGAQVNVIESVVVDGVNGTVANKTLTINGGFAKAADVYTKTAADSMVDGKIATALGSVYEYKGSVANYTDLPKSGVDKGDVYNVENGWDLYAAGTNVAWNGTSWDPLGGTFDVSELTEDIEKNAEDIAKNAQAVLDEKGRAEGVEGQLRTDLGTKNDEASEEGSAFARIANLAALVGEMTGGSTTSIATQIATAKSELKGDASANADTLGKLEDLIEAEAAKARAAESANTTAISNEESRAKGEESRIEGLIAAEKQRAEGVEGGLETRLATAESTISKLDGADTVAGSVKKQIKDAVAAEAERATGVEGGLANRIQALENSVGEGGSVAEDIQANANAIAAIQADYLKQADKTELSNAINDAKSAANGYTDTEIGKAKKYAEDEADASESAAKAYADSLAKNYDAAGAAATVQGKLDEEVIRAKAAEKKNADAIAALTTTVESNESDIEGKMTALTNRVSANETAIGTNSDNIATNLGKINAMDAAYKKADQDLKSELTGAASDAVTSVTLHGVRNYADSLLLWHEA